MVGAVGQYVLDGTEAEVPGEEQICTHMSLPVSGGRVSITVISPRLSGSKL